MNQKALLTVGNILQTVWFLVLIAVSLLNATFSFLKIIPATSTSNVSNILLLLLLIVLSWMAQSKFEIKGWRIFLLIEAVLSILYFGSLIAGIIFIVAYVKANKELR